LLFSRAIPLHDYYSDSGVTQSIRHPDFYLRYDVITGQEKWRFCALQRVFVPCRVFRQVRFGMLKSLFGVQDV
jgi:hypothetical protein